MLDLLIEEAEIFDGTGKPSFTGSVAVHKDRMEAVGKVENSKARRVIDGRGLILAPGFIDVHSHSDYHLCIWPRADSKVRQGVTTEIGGNCGYAAAPILDSLAREREKSFKKYYGLSLPWLSVSEYFHKLESQKISVNFGLLVGHNTLRASVMNGDNRPPNEAELQKMQQLLKQGMEEGALGLSTGLIYSPACFSTSEEMVALAKVLRPYRSLMAFHMRSEGKKVVEAVAEAIEIGRKAQIGIQISHLKTSGPQNWSKIDPVFDLIEEARNQGHDVQADRYPYTASYTGLSAVFPEWVLEGTKTEMLTRLRDSMVRKRIEREVLLDHPEPDYWDRIRIAQSFNPKNKDLEGLTLRECAQRRNQEVFEAIYSILEEEEAQTTAIYFTMSEENFCRIISKDYCFVASDAALRATEGPLFEGKPHPRAYGTFPRMLSEYVRKKKVVDWSQAIQKMTGGPARRFHLKNRGVIQKGAYADLVLIDPSKVEDKATYIQPHQYPVGIPYVIVNGVVTIDQNEHTSAMAGHVLRRKEG
ncbi:MAG: D-aminoacylase [Deltaproteobacteria bacterium]|nr:D-aminoacylase [Deltaproteobacteria bacterium]